MVLLYDGTCGFCARSVQFVLAHERARRDLNFAALDSKFGRDLLARYPRLRGVDSMVLATTNPDNPQSPPQLLVRSDAALAVANYLGGRWRILAKAVRLVPRALRDAAYNLIANHRHKLGANSPCPLPSAEQRHRFLD
jgi:predicted DCC family thiol-disulfide oxidoreductase YuxK